MQRRGVHAHYPRSRPRSSLAPERFAHLAHRVRQLRVIRGRAGQPRRFFKGVRRIGVRGRPEQLRREAPRALPLHSRPGVQRRLVLVLTDRAEWVGPRPCMGALAEPALAGPADVGVFIGLGTLLGGAALTAFAAFASVMHPWTMSIWAALTAAVALWSRRSDKRAREAARLTPRQQLIYEAHARRVASRRAQLVERTTPAPNGAKTPARAQSTARG